MTRCVLALTMSMLAGASSASAQTVDPVVSEAVIKAPVAEVWKAFTTKAGMESWMVAKTDIDLQVGGAWRTSYRRDSSLDDGTTIHQTILALDPERMFSFRTVKPPSDFPFPNAIIKAWTVVYFEPAGPVTTKVTVRMMGFTADEESQKMRAFFERGNKATVDSLVKRFATSPAP